MLFKAQKLPPNKRLFEISLPSRDQDAKCLRVQLCSHVHLSPGRPAKTGTNASQATTAPYRSGTIVLDKLLLSDDRIGAQKIIVIRRFSASEDDTVGCSCSRNTRPSRRDSAGSWSSSNNRRCGETRRPATSHEPARGNAERPTGQEPSSQILVRKSRASFLTAAPAIPPSTNFLSQRCCTPVGLAILPIICRPSGFSVPAKSQNRKPRKHPRGE